MPRSSSKHDELGIFLFISLCVFSSLGGNKVDLSNANQQSENHLKRVCDKCSPERLISSTQKCIKFAFIQVSCKAVKWQNFVFGFLSACLFIFVVFFSVFFWLFLFLFFPGFVGLLDFIFFF